jgi:two-component system sensor histidine kinase KdpD
MKELRRTLQWCAIGTLGVALVTFLAFRLHLSFATVSFSFLLLLVLQSLSGNFASSAIVSLLAVGCLDYFFVAPLFSFQIATPLDSLGLSSFLITGLVITKLVTKLKHQTEVSRLHHERLTRLYDLAQQLLALDPSVQSVKPCIELFRGTFGIRAVCLIDAAGSEVYVAGEARHLTQKTQAALDGNENAESTEKEDDGISVRRIRAGGRTIGAIGFEGLDDPGLTAGPLTALAAAHLERMHSFIQASRAAAAVQTESYRSVILDALAHEFKTPLATILTAAGALREVRSLDAQHSELAEIVESEAARLGRLTSRLIRTARLEREEVKPWIELIDVSSILSETADQYAKLCTNRGISVVKDCESSEAMADPELLRLAVSQLLDNACKYSTPGSTVTLKISRDSDRIALRVVSKGDPIPLSERSKIFDRFYRGVDGLRIGPGSGVGLFVARKIAIALGGSLHLESERTDSGNTVFRLTLPLPESETAI